MTIKDLLKDRLTLDEMELAPSSFDIVGDRESAIAIVEIADELRPKARIIAEAIARQHKNVKTVLLKSSPRRGVRRLPKYEAILGDNTEVFHTEHGLRFRVDPTKVYFSVRESTERARVADLVRAGETVCVFFAGAGPLAVTIAKKAKPERVIGIEINPDAVRYFRENVRLNKADVEVVEGDARERAADYYGKCDRVLMPLPESAAEFLKEAIRCAKPGGIVHFYCFCESPDEYVQKILDAGRKMDRKIEIIETQNVLQYGPGIWKMRIDFIVR